ncbi:MAG: depupylase/deamidase Dop [Actinomycetota bacterium]|nr:depupylase/deamidase Dop [Actinomycetota bacterium]MDA8294411.1 depupylase/deamidase Dop [Actinomycetota bacterium]
MAIPKVCGIETEYGIHVVGGDPNPIAASSVLINAYLQEVVRQRTGWDFEDESPGNDARGAPGPDALPPQVETHLVNAVLTNGARYYVDHAHPEFSTPECADALECVRYDRAGEEILVRSMEAAAATVTDGRTLVVYKNNSDGKGNSYGTHENYLVDRSVPFDRVVAAVTPHFVTRQIFTGSGKVGAETATLDGHAVEFQLSQRAEFFEEPVGLETTLKRPIVNTRDEPHADSRRYRRLHVIVGDANLCEVATFLKVGTTSLVLAMLEDDALARRPLGLADPVRAMYEVSLDRSLGHPLALADGTTATALDVQWELFGAARKYADERGLACMGDEAVGEEVLRRWEHVLHALETEPASLARQLDWVAKLQLIEAYRDRHGCGWDDPRLAALDLQYHDLRPARSLFARLDTERLVTADEVARAVTEPPRRTRAWFRGQCLQRWPDAVVTANWDSLVFDVGTDPLRRVPMMDPLRGTAEHVDELLQASTSPADLLDRLSS